LLLGPRDYKPGESLVKGLDAVEHRQNRHHG
jgi:hypothetical protein